MKFTSPAKRVFFFLPCLVVFNLGFLWYLISNTSLNISYKCLRFLHVITNCRFNEIFNNFIALFKPKRTFNEAAIETTFGTFSSEKIDTIVEEIKKNGYFIFEEKLSEKQIHEISEFALKTPVPKLMNLGKYSEEKYTIKDLKTPESPRYQFKNENLFECKYISDLVFEELFLEIAQRYLNCRPIFDYLVMWWSFPFHGKMASEAAQMYHYDMDRIRFIKFFFYLTDVNPETGPHCFVRGSHHSKPNNLLKDGRIKDEEIEANFQKQDILEICGKKGTIIAVDTIGFHKGKMLEKDSRLLLQILYSNNLFGQTNEKIKVPLQLKKEYNTFLETNKDVFESNMSFE